MQTVELWMLRIFALVAGGLWLVANIDWLEQWIDVRVYVEGVVWTLCALPCIVIAFAILRPVVAWAKRY